MKEKVKVEMEVMIPEGHFCGGNCSDCVYYEMHNRNPSERNGCASYREY